MALHILVGRLSKRDKPVLLYLGDSGSEAAAARAADTTYPLHEVFENAHGRRKNNPGCAAPASPALSQAEAETAAAVELQAKARSEKAAAKAKAEAAAKAKADSKAAAKVAKAEAEAKAKAEAEAKAKASPAPDSPAAPTSDQSPPLSDSSSA